jgi:PAS domain S-box-containing protein
VFKEQELVLAQQIAGLAIWEWSARTDEFTWLPGSTPLFGHPPEQLRTRADVLQCVVPEDRERIALMRDEAVRAGEEYKSEYRVMWPNGETRWIRAHGRGVEHPERGRLLLGVSQDITEEKKREEKLRAQARLLDLAYEPIMVRDSKDCIVYWNEGAQRLYGYSWQEAKGQVGHELLQTTFPQELQEIQQQLHATGFWQGELIQVTKDGRHVRVESRWQAFSTNGLSTLETDFDLSYQEAVQIARTWEEKAALVADMSHEINNPLSIALSAAHLLKSDDKDRQQYIAMLEDAIMRIADFVKKSGDIHRSVQLELRRRKPKSSVQ